MFESTESAVILTLPKICFCFFLKLFTLSLKIKLLQILSALYMLYLKKRCVYNVIKEKTSLNRTNS